MRESTEAVDHHWPKGWGSALFAVAACLIWDPGLLRAALEFEATTIELGVVRGGVPIRHDFKFRNTGDQPVRLVEIRAGCGCLLPRLEKRTFQPGESGSIPFEVHTLGESAGPHRWYLYLAYRNGHRTGTVVLQVRARVITEVTVRPKELKIRGTAAHRQTIQLIDMRDRPLRVRALRSSDDSWRLRYLGTRRDPSGHWVFTFEFAVPGGSTEDEQNGWILIDTDDPIYRTLRLPVSLRRQSPLRVTATPRRLRFRNKDGQNLQRSIVLACPARSEVRIRSVETSHQALAVKVHPRGGTVVKLEVTVLPDRLPGGSVAGEIRVDLERPTRQTVVVPVLVDSLEPSAANLPVANDVELERGEGR